MSDPIYIEFESEDEAYWGCNNWPELRDTFGINPADLKRWHAVMSGQGRAWEILRRIYQVSTVMQPDPDTMREWSRLQVAQSMGIKQATVDDEIAAALQTWRKRDATATAARGIDGLSAEDFERLTNFSGGRGMDEDRVEALLGAHGFDKIKDPKFRAEMALRIVSLHRQLASSHQRAGAMELLRLEASMHANGLLILFYQGEIERLMEVNAAGIKTLDIQKLQEKVEALEDRTSKMATSHAKVSETIGANELDIQTRKLLFIETINHLIELTLAWEKDPDHWRPDGTWTADEIEWLMTPSGERPALYRFDIALRNCEAMAPENFWNPDYVPRNTPRLVCERLASMMKRLGPLGQSDDDTILDAVAAGTGPDEDDEEDEEEFSDVVGDDTDQLVNVDASPDGGPVPSPSSFGKPASTSVKVF